MVVVDSVAGLVLGLVVCRSRHGGLGLICRDWPDVVACACAAEIGLGWWLGLALPRSAWGGGFALSRSAWGGGFTLSLVVCRGSPTQGLVHGLIYGGFCLLWVDLRWWW